MPVRFPVLMPNGTIQDQDCLTVAELAAQLQTSRDAVYRRTASGEWPYVKVVRRVYFTPDDVRTILAMSHHVPNGAPVGRHIPQRSNVRRIGER